MSNQEPYRIPKRTASDPNQSGSQGSCVRPNQEGNVKKEESVNSAPRRMFTLPSSSSTSGAQVFNPIGKCQVQTNSFKIDITKMPKRLLRLSMETRLCGGKTELNLNDGVQAVAGNLNSQEDFTTQEWSQISNYLRKKNAEFKVKISPNGFVYTNGPNSLSDANRQELPRLVEIATSEVLNTPEYLQFGNQTYAVNEPAVSSPDALSEIRSGFDKSVRLVDGENGSTEIIMTIDNKLAPFHKSTSVLKMICDKFEEIVNPARQHRGSQDRRGDRDRGYRGGRSYGHDNRRRSRSRSPQDRGDRGDRGNHHRDHNEDWDERKVKEVERRLLEEPRALGSIADALKGLIVESVHLSKDVNRNVIVKGLTDRNAEDRIKLNEGKNDEQEISVADYYLKQYNYKLKFPYLPMIVSKRFRSETMFPVELLKIVPGQKISIQKINPNVQSAMTGPNSILPSKHVRIVARILESSLKIASNPYLKTFGIRISKDPIKLEAKILSPAQLSFNKYSIMPKPGSVQFEPSREDKFFKPAKIYEVAVIAFRVVSINLSDFCMKLCDLCRRSGLEIRRETRDWIKIENFNPTSTIELKEQMKRLQQSNCSIIIGITEEKKPEVHDVLKYFEAAVGLQTMQIHSKTAGFIISGNGQTAGNVIKKLNLKCGGINYIVEVPQSFNRTVVCSNNSFVQKKLFDGTQFIGFEMTHGAARTLFDKSNGTFDGEPTIVGCAYSLQKATDLGGFNWFQEQNEYRLKNLGTHIPKCLQYYKESSGSLPEKIVIYRTGAGEGDFDRVQQEITEIRSSFAEVQEGYKPSLVVIVANKTSHLRVFPVEIREGDTAMKQNVRSGTCLDGKITSAGREEFVLISQTALISTAKPTKYTIAANDPKWSKNEVMNLTYILSFAHQVCYQPPAVPHILYAADNLAKRGRNNFIQHKKLGELSKTIQATLTKYSDLNIEMDSKELSGELVEDITKSMNVMAIKARNFWA